MTHSTEALRITMLEGGSVPWSGIEDWARTLATAFGWFLAGLAVFTTCERSAQRSGTLSAF